MRQNRHVRSAHQPVKSVFLQQSALNVQKADSGIRRDAVSRPVRKASTQRRESVLNAKNDVLAA